MNYDPLHPYNMSTQELEEELSSIDVPQLQDNINYLTLAAARQRSLTDAEYALIGEMESRLERAEALDQELIKREYDKPSSWTEIARD